MKGIVFVVRFWNSQIPRDKLTICVKIYCMKVRLCYANLCKEAIIEESEERRFRNKRCIHVLIPLNQKIFTHSSALGQLEERRLCFVGILKKEEQK